MGSGDVSHCRTSAFDNHFDYSFIVLKHIQQSFLMRRVDVWENKINIVRVIGRSMRVLSFFEMCEVVNELHVCSLTSLPVLYDSDSCFHELRRSDPINQVRGYHPTSILHPKKCFLIPLNCAELKFISYTPN